MTEEFNDNDQLEYNDGLGDLLKEKDQLQFSWAKTATVLGIILGITVVLFLGLFKMSDSPKTATLEEVQTDVIETITEPEITIEVETAPVVVETVSTVKESISEPVIEPVKVQAEAVQTKKQIFRVFAGTYTDKTNADVMKATLQNTGFDAFTWVNVKDGQKVYMVQAGSFRNRNAAEQHIKRLSAKGIDANIAIY